MEMEMQMQQEPDKPKWEYIETRSAKIRATPQIELIPHWYGLQEADEIREIMKRAVVAVNSHDALIEALRFQRDALHDLCDDSELMLTLPPSVHAKLANMRDDVDSALAVAQEQS